MAFHLNRFDVVKYTIWQLLSICWLSERKKYTQNTIYAKKHVANDSTCYVIPLSDTSSKCQFALLSFMTLNKNIASADIDWVGVEIYVCASIFLQHMCVYELLLCFVNNIHNHVVCPSVKRTACRQTNRMRCGLIEIDCCCTVNFKYKFKASI